MKTIQRTFLAALLACQAAVAADGIAFITNIKGEAAVDGNPRPLLLSELSRGQKVTVGKDSLVTVMYISSGKEFVLKGPNDYLVKEAEIAGSAGTPAAARETPWRTTHRVLAQAAQTSAASVRMRSVAPPKAAEAPASFPATGAVASLQPTFRWRGPDPKAPGEFTLLVIGQDKPVHVGKATGGTYRVPAKLRPETEYAWTVTSAGAQAGGGRFRTLSSEAVAQVEKRKPADKAEFSDRLLFALMLQEMGATQEAQESWARLAQERGDLPELASLAK